MEKSEPKWKLTGNQEQKAIALNAAYETFPVIQSQWVAGYHRSHRTAEDPRPI
jgi:hypothetical protein